MTLSNRTAMRERPVPTGAFHYQVAVISSDIPEGMTIAEYRRSRGEAKSRGRLFRGKR